MNRHRVLGELVTFRDAKAFHHDGILYQGDSNRCTIVHIHGSYGNFYQNEFLRVMAKTYANAAINFLSFNLTGHDAVTEGYRNEWDFEYTGGAISTFDACVSDIQAAVDFVTPFSDRIILQGHSLGCDRLLHYLLATKVRHDIILLSPCDSYQLQANWIAPETIDTQLERLKEGAQGRERFDWLPLSEYGIRQRDWDYPIPITRQPLLALLESSVFRLLRFSQPAAFSIDQKALVYLGGDDSLQTVPRDAMLNYISKRVRHLTATALYPEGDHSLWGCEQEVSDEIVTWIGS